MIKQDYWFDVIYPIFEPFKEEVREIWKNDSELLAIRDLLKLPPKVIQACRVAGIEADEVDLLDRFASMIFQHLCG